MKSEKQKLIDMMFEIAVRMHQGDIHFANREDAAAYVADQLRQNGFNTTPVGFSWGMLQETVNSAPAGGIPSTAAAAGKLMEALDLLVADKESREAAKALLMQVLKTESQVGVVIGMHKGLELAATGIAEMVKHAAKGAEEVK